MERPSDRLKKEIFQLLDVLAGGNRIPATPDAVEVSKPLVSSTANTGDAPQPTCTNTIFKINKIILHGNIEIR